MKCIIVDDEPLAREGIELNIASAPSLELVAQFNNAIDAGEYIKNHKVDLMFLDIEMPKLNGLNFLRTLSRKPFVIITTAYPQFALEAFELEVIDYLVKPIRLERFIKAVNSVQQFFEAFNKTASFEKVEEDFIYIRADRKFVRLFYSEILFIKGMKDYVMIFAKDQRFMTAMNIKTISDQLPASIFVRVSKSYLINKNFIDFIDQDFINIGKHEIPLGRTYKQEFLEKHIKTKLIDRK